MHAQLCLSNHKEKIEEICGWIGGAMNEWDLTLWNKTIKKATRWEAIRAVEKRIQKMKTFEENQHLSPLYFWIKQVIVSSGSWLWRWLRVSHIYEKMLVNRGCSEMIFDTLPIGWYHHNFIPSNGEISDSEVTSDTAFWAQIQKKCDGDLSFFIIK